MYHTNFINLIILMPQLDIELLEDFLFFAFIALFLGFGDADSEEAVIQTASENYLAEYYISTRKILCEESNIVATSFTNNL